ncbi:hypothetical protein ASPSYDRAFT_139709 [Aspergillus sydowii CBS 593.65]|uniref:ABM domain-containing protein n=1 Tax=Aspergillus sydowii CBS 593.65 TaxID=1036612 RepID=A0A1L9TYJ9_9EURO|nr:uncharacterized protein ASPSYDRAFT_139709 [Aspergillus sydowii CBS 593.65]OJJ64514.1 hypothetical protein ASPSYDRAFT_139709 [Aspergillus sydowii CBS 593.65]
MPAVTEFIYFQTKSSVKPEDPSNDEGAALLQLFKATKSQSGHLSSAWGRTTEDENIIVWAIDWSDSHSGIQQTNSPLDPFLEQDTQLTTLYTTLQPSDLEAPATQAILSNPITELTPLAFPTSLSKSDRSALSADLVNFRTTLLQEVEENVRSKTFLLGQVERPGEFEHDKSDSGQVFVQFLVVGWESYDQHQEARGTDGFKQRITPIREKMISPLNRLGMKHVKFQKV